MDIFSTNFSTIDWVIVGVYLLGAVVVGIIANRYIHSVSAYLVGGGESGTSLNVATYIGTGLGLVTLMYASMESFSMGFAYVTVAVIGAVVGVILGSTGLVIHRLRELNLLTIPEYFEKRYSRRVRIVGGVICALAGILNMGLFPKMGATFITYVTGYGGGSGHENTINLITTLLIVLVLVYTVLGGMVSVIVTDYIQFVVLSVGMAIGVYFVLTHPDLGWTTITDTMASQRGERMFNPVAEGGYGWTWIVFMFMLFLSAGICWAPEASRALTAKNSTVAKRTFLFAAPGQFVRLAIPALWACAAFCLVAQNAELMAHFFPDGMGGAARHAEQAMPLVIGKIMPAGLLGILVAGLMAAFMSTHDSYLLCWSSVISRDIIAPLKRTTPDERAQIKTTRISIVCIGVFLMIWGVWYKLPDSVWSYMAITGTIYLSGAAPALIGGVYWKRASSAGAMAALFGGLVSVCGLFREQANEALGWNITNPQLGLFNFLFCAVLLVGVSLAVPDKKPVGE